MSTSTRLLLSTGLFALLVALLTACSDGPGLSNVQGPSSTSLSTSAILTPTTAHATAQPTPQKTPRPEHRHTPTPTPRPTTTFHYTDSSSAAQAVLQLINQERASKGLPALKWNTGLVKSAHLHNVLMLKENSLSHQLPGEAGLLQRITAQGVNGYFFAENIGYGWGNPLTAASGLNTAMFNEKPPENGHRLNILSKATSIGIDVIINTKNNQVWLTEDFAQVA